jgi:hypothetical protein
MRCWLALSARLRYSDKVLFWTVAPVGAAPGGLTGLLDAHAASITAAAIRETLVLIWPFMLTSAGSEACRNSVIRCVGLIKPRWMRSWRQLDDGITTLGLGGLGGDRSRFKKKLSLACNVSVARNEQERLANRSEE